MHDDLGNHAREEVLDQADGEAETGPVVSELHDLEAVTVEVNVAVKVHLVEGLHGDFLLAVVLGLVLGLLEAEVVLYALTRVLGLLILAGTDGRDHQPVDGQERQTGKDGEEQGSFGATADLP